MASWPTSAGHVPGSWPLGVVKSTSNGLLRTAMDSGPVKVRKRFTVETTTYTLPSNTFIVSGVGRASLETFYNTTLNGGVDSFTWADPEGPKTSATQTLTLRFVAAPIFTAILPSADQDDQKFSVALKFETVP